MRTKLLKLVRKRIDVLHNTATNEYMFRDNKTNACSGMIYEYEYQSKWSDDLDYILGEKNKYVLDKLRFDIYNKKKCFWKKERFKESNIVKL